MSSSRNSSGNIRKILENLLEESLKSWTNPSSNSKTEVQQGILEVIDLGISTGIPPRSSVKILQIFHKKFLQGIPWVILKEISWKSFWKKKKSLENLLTEYLWDFSENCLEESLKKKTDGILGFLLEKFLENFLEELWGNFFTKIDCRNANRKYFEDIDRLWRYCWKNNWRNTRWNPKPHLLLRADHYVEIISCCE